MKSLLICFSLVSISLWGQAAPSVPAPWDVSKSVTELAAQVAKLKPVLANLTPQAWVNQGAPSAYLAQWQSAEHELDYLAQTARALETQPEKMTIALDLYFRIQGIEWRLQSLSEGARKYQNAAAADQLAEAVGVHATQRDQLRQYITDLAAQNEQEMAVMDREAQRCRETQNTSRPVLSPGAAPAKRNSKAK